MQKHLYKYATFRVVPVIEREEFINVGVILYCKKEKYIRMRYHLCEDKILALMPDADIPEIKTNMEAYRRIAAGEKSCGPIANLNEAERFGWLTAVRSATIQTSRPHPGVCDNLENTLNALFSEMVE